MSLPLVWYSSAGAVTAQPLPVGFYYADLLETPGTRAVQFSYNVALLATITIESSNQPDPTIYSSSTRHWSEEVALPTVTAAGVAGSSMVQMVGNGAERLRAVANVTQEGELLGWAS